MLSSVLVNIVLGIHLLFIIFVIFGGIAVLQKTWVVWFHLPAAIWAVLLELFGWICPLTPLEQWLRTLSGQSSYEVGFIEHYLLQIVYPEALTRELQILFGLLVLTLNGGIYTYCIMRKRGKKQ